MKARGGGLREHIKQPDITEIKIYVECICSLAEAGEAVGSRRIWAAARVGKISRGTIRLACQTQICQTDLCMMQLVTGDHHVFSDCH